MDEPSNKDLHQMLELQSLTLAKEIQRVESNLVSLIRVIRTAAFVSGTIGTLFAGMFTWVLLDKNQFYTDSIKGVQKVVERQSEIQNDNFERLQAQNEAQTKTEAELAATQKIMAEIVFNKSRGEKR